jgi:PHD/YefM family antitoxin component YafN of YafNO toxin-antitoxin module
MSEKVPASEFTKNFGRYKMQAQREAVAVSSHGQIAGYFVGAHEYEELLKLKGNRRSFATVDLPDEKVKAIMSSRMDKRHDHLNKVLDRKK